VKTPNQRTIVSDIQTLPGMDSIDSRDILVQANGHTKGFILRPITKL
jgi:hypothetical protein